MFSRCKALSHASSDRILYFNKITGEWRLNPSVQRAKGDRLVRDNVLPVCDIDMQELFLRPLQKGRGRATEPSQQQDIR